jgi:alkaline phosphatase
LHFFFRVALHIFNLSGQLVRTLLDRDLPAGEHQTCWDGRNENGKSLATGVYLIIIRSNHREERLKVLLLR